MVKTLPSNAGGAGLIPGRGANRSNIITNSIKTLKVVHIKKIFKKIVTCIVGFVFSEKQLANLKTAFLFSLFIQTQLFYR